MQLPVVIDPNRALVSFIRQRESLKQIICNDLSHIAGELYSKGIIARDTHSKVSYHMHTENERAVKLLDAIESRIRVKPSVLKEFICILESEPYTSSLADALIQSYCEFKMMLDV